MAERSLLRGRAAAGTTMTENVVIVSLVAVGVLLAVTAFGKQVANLFSRSSDALNTGSVAGAKGPGMDGAYVAIKGGGGGGGGHDDDDDGDSPFHDHADAAPGGGGGGGTVGTKEEELAKAKDLLKSTPEGAALVKFLEDKGIPIEFKEGDGSYHSKGKIVIGPPFDAQNMAFTLAHEANHAQYFKEGRQADRMKDTRDDYVRKKLDEEVVGTVGPIELKKKLNAAGKGITATFPLEAEYNAAYDKAVADLKAKNPKATAADLEAAGRKAGFDAVKKGFEDGKVTTSNTHEKYPDYYGKSWDEAHPK